MSEILIPIIGQVNYAMSQLKIVMVDVNAAINLVIEINNMLVTYIENDKKYNGTG